MTDIERDYNTFLRAEAYYLEPPEEQPEDDDDEYTEDDAREDAELARAEWKMENW